MNREDDFFNTLKDCWIGKKFVSKVDMIPNQNVEILKDDGHLVTYKIGCIWPGDEKYVQTIHTMTRKHFKETMLRFNHFVEVKNYDEERRRVSKHSERLLDR